MKSENLTYNRTIEEKVPAAILHQIYSFFQDVYLSNGYLPLVQVYYDTQEKTFSVTCPNQKLTSVSTEYKHDSLIDENKTLFLEIYSHGQMTSFLSETEFKSLSENVVFGVAGRVNSKFELKFWVKQQGRVLDLQIEDVFENNTFVKTSWPKKWFMQLSLHS